MWSFRNTTVRLTDDDFGTVLVQLRALGLITRSDRKRSVKDRGAYWTLTPYGDEHLTTLRAISRDPAPAPEGEGEGEGEGEDETGSEEEEASAVARAEA
jgi:DNA-binding PadR family transcriptional regulator